MPFFCSTVNVEPTVDVEPTVVEPFRKRTSTATTSPTRTPTHLFSGLFRRGSRVHPTPESGSPATSNNPSPTSSGTLVNMGITTCDGLIPLAWLVDGEELEVTEHRLGSGSFSVVYRGQYRGDTVAVKVLSRARIKKSELAVHRKFPHPNIVNFVGAVERPYNLVGVVLEFVPNTLSTMLADRRVAVTQLNALSVAHGVAKAMAFLNKKTEFVHRDIKTANILVDPREDGWIGKVCDFGFAAPAEDARRHAKVCQKLAKYRQQDVGAIDDGDDDLNPFDLLNDSNLPEGYVGTCAWSAPEVLLRVEYSERADVYAFGLVLWSLFSRRYPFSNMHHDRIVAAVTTAQRPAIPPTAPADVVDLIKLCWHHQTSKRPRFATVEKAVAAAIASLADPDAEIYHYRVGGQATPVRSSLCDTRSNLAVAR